MVLLGSVVICQEWGCCAPIHLLLQLGRVRNAGD